VKLLFVLLIIVDGFLGVEMVSQGAISDNDLFKLCSEDYKKNCPSSTYFPFSFQGHQCLHDHRDKLSKDCKEFSEELYVFREKRAQEELFIHCKSEVKEFCSCYDPKTEAFGLTFCLAEKFVDLSCSCRKAIREEMIKQDFELAERLKSFLDKK